MSPCVKHTLRTLTRLLLVSGIALAAATASAQEFSSKDLIPVQRPVADLMPPPPSPSYSRPGPGPSGLKVTAWVDHEDNTYAFGDNVVLSVKSNRDAYLTIINVGTSGRVHIIFPNRYQTSNRIRAGETIQVPNPEDRFDFQVSGPAGAELIKVIASQNPAALFEDDDIESAEGPFKKLKKSAPGVAKDLDVVLREPRNQDWDAYNKIIRIVPR